MRISDWSSDVCSSDLGRAERPGRHQEPPQDGEDVGGDHEEQHATRNRRVELLDAVPLVAGGILAADRIALCYCHGLSSSARTLFFALSKRDLLEGQKV